MTKQITIKEGIPELGILAKNKDAWVSSITLKDIFDKDHNHILRDIKNIKEKVVVQFWAANFIKTTYKNRGKKYPCYLLNRKSFTLVAMGFTGKKAIDFKVKYIEAFESMKSHIETREISKSGYKIMTGAVAKYIDNNPLTFSKEADMVNKCVICMTAKDFKQVNNTKDTRDAVITDKLNDLDEAQRMNARFIKAGLNFDERKKIITDSFKEV